jgi:DNA polymerase I-like protein with 3'-5' exonuclease and polymerase domains
MTAPPVLVPAMKRARKDPVARLLSVAQQLGVRFRISGATLQVAGAGALHPDDQAILRTYIEDIRARLETPAPEHDLLDELDIQVEYIADAARAQTVLAALGPQALGFDIETAPIAHNGGRPWLKLTKDGRRAVHQPDRDDDKAGLDPLCAAPRLASVYDSAGAIVYVLDFRYLPITVLDALGDRPLLIHHAGFDNAMVAGQGVHLQRPYCTLLMARLTHGAERGGLRGLAEIAPTLLGLQLPKEEQVSDWSAERFSEQQLRYAAIDAVAAYGVGKAMWSGLDVEARHAFRLGNATVPIVAAMRLAGIPFDRAVHEQTIAAWEAAYSQAHDAFVAIAGMPPPLQGKPCSEWLEPRVPEDMLSWWPRTPSGLLRTRSADLDRLAAVPEIRPLLDVAAARKRLQAFGHSLLEKIGPDGRLHMDLKPAATKTGRCACAKPNLQQLPQDVREAVITGPGRILVVADYSQIEFRCAAELSGDENMRAVFRDGGDLHVLNAEDFIGASLDTLPADEREIVRSKAKRIGFGTLYGSGARGLVASAWSMYRIEMSEAEAQSWKDRFYDRYPQLRAWQQRTADEARVTGVLRSVAGRPLRAEWEPVQPLKWTLCCNYPVQSSAADVMALAMTKVHAALAPLDARLILQIHDELVVECAEDLAPAVEALLSEHMTAAWSEVFPDAPVRGIVDVASRKCWAKPVKEKR